MYVVVDILGKGIKQKSYQRKERNKHCRTSWFMELLKMFFSLHSCDVTLHVELIE